MPLKYFLYYYIVFVSLYVFSLDCKFFEFRDQIFTYACPVFETNRVGIQFINKWSQETLRTKDRSRSRRESKFLLTH